MPPSISSWQEAESLASAHMRQLGLSRPHLTPPGSDGGVDVLADEAAAQVKFEKNKTTGKPAVQQLYGEATRRGVRGIFYSLSGYSAPALSFANETGIALFQMRLDGSVVPVNGLAGQLVMRFQRPVPQQPVRQETRPATRSPWWLAFFTNGRWYLVFPIASIGILAFVPFIHAGIKLRDRKTWLMAATYGAITVVWFVVYSAIRPADRDQPPPEPIFSILVVFMLVVTVSACVLLSRIRRQIYNLDTGGVATVRNAMTG